MSHPPEGAVPIRWHAAATGAALLTAFLAIGDYYGYAARFGGSRAPGAFNLSFVSTGEYRLWLASTLLLIPGAILLCNGFAGPLSALLSHVVHRIAELDLRARRLAGGALFVVLVASYRLGRRVLLRDHMITDDETIIRFGGQILAMGQLSAERAWPPNTFTELYTATVDGRIFAMDWPGGLAVAALAEASALGAWVYAGIAAAGCLAISRAAERLAGRGAGCLAAVFWIASPMVWTLSLTRHTHLVSRTLIVFALLACAHLWCSREDGSEPGRAARLGWPLLLGASVGFSFLCRPAETAAIMAPAGVYLMWRGIREAGSARRQLALAALGLLPFLALMALYNQLQTGQAWVSPRGLPQAVVATVEELSVRERLGANLSFNLMMLGVWFLGVAGLPLAYLGALRRDVIPRLCFLGLGLHLLVALAHGNVGIHMVGPIHYSESVVPLILLASVGSARLAELASGPMRRVAGPSLLGYLLALASFGAVYAQSLGGLGRVADIPHAAARAANLRNAVVLSPAPHQIDRLTPGSNGSWQHLHAPPDPALQGSVFFVRHDVDLAVLRRALPDRDYYRLIRDAKTGRFEVRPLSAGR